MTLSLDRRSPCDSLLNYLYDELDAAGRAEFESHVGSCTSCRTELDAFKQVRGAAKEAIPVLEPSPRVAGPLHTQLLHEAARRALRGGRVLRFARRVATHPGYAAAAALVLVGGAVGLQWSRGRIFIQEPPSLHSESTAPAAAPGSATSKVPEHDDQTALQDSVLKALTPSKKVTMKKSAPPARMGYIKGDLRDDLDDNMRGMKGGGAGKDAETGVDRRSSPAQTSATPTSTPPANGRSASTQAPIDSLETGELSKTSSANGPPAKEKPRMQAAQERSDEVSLAPTAAPTAAPMAQAPAAPPPSSRSALGAKDQSAQALDGHALLAKAEKLASGDRCDEAVRLYADLDRRYPTMMTPKIRLPYVRCLRAIGRLDEEATTAKLSTKTRANTQHGSGQQAQQHRGGSDAGKRQAPVKKAKNAKPGPDFDSDSDSGEVAPIFKALPGS